MKTGAYGLHVSKQVLATAESNGWTDANTDHVLSLFHTVFKDFQHAFTENPVKDIKPGKVYRTRKTVSCRGFGCSAVFCTMVRARVSAYVPERERGERARF